MLEKRELPQEVLRLFVDILNKERDFIGEKAIDDGYLVKGMKNRATITFSDGKKVYSAKFAWVGKMWKMAGLPSMWSSIRDITLLP